MAFFSFYMGILLQLQNTIQNRLTLLDLTLLSFLFNQQGMGVLKIELISIAFILSK